MTVHILLVSAQQAGPFLGGGGEQDPGPGPRAFCLNLETSRMKKVVFALDLENLKDGPLSVATTMIFSVIGLPIKSRYHSL